MALSERGPNQSSPVHFGAFELDLRTGELRKHGIRVKLQDQPFQVLQALVERPGELVTREELRNRIWADGAFVDFDQSLNRAVNKVREALSDTAANPRYIETMARRGYRFVAAVEGAPKTASPSASPAAPPRSAAGRPWGKVAWFAAGVLVATGVALWFTRESARLPPARVVPLTTYPGIEINPASSPDGSRVAFSWDGEDGANFDLYVKTVGNVTPLRLTTDPAADGYPAWSPDGRQIAFASERDGGGIYIVSTDGGTQRRIADLRSVCPPVWTTDGRYLFVAKRHTENQPESGDGALFLTPVDGAGAPRQVLAPPAGTWYIYPALAPDGHSLVFASCTGTAAAPQCSLQETELRGAVVALVRPRQIAGNLGTVSGIAWTPDSSSVIFSAGLTTPNLWRVNVKHGNEPERIELAGDRARHPSIDLRTGRLIFSRGLAEIGIWRVEHAGKPAPFLTSSSSHNVNPQYSPDGRRIAFNSSRQVGGDAIWIANADGTGAAQITSIDAPFAGTPRWAPEGRRLAFDAVRNGHWDIWVVEVSGNSPRQLTHGLGDNAIPSWSHDGSSIYFASNRTGRSEIWRIPVSGSPAVQVTRNGGYCAFESPDGKTLYYTMSGPAAEGIYAKSLPDGEEKQTVKEQIAKRAFAVFSNGIFYIHQRGIERLPDPLLRLCRWTDPYSCGRHWSTRLRLGGFSRPKHVPVLAIQRSGKRSHAHRELPVSSRDHTLVRQSVPRQGRHRCAITPSHPPQHLPRIRRVRVPPQLLPTPRIRRHLRH